jgi:hypothetical protein
MPLIALVALSALSGQSGERVIVIEGSRPASEGRVSAKAMRLIPFNVPRGVTRISIKKELDHGPEPTSPKIVDHGLFDANGTEARGFRGWMGGHPADIAITGSPETTSTWFIPGPLPAGRWHLAQYYLQSTPAGLRFKYTITLGFDGPKPPAQMPKIPPLKQGKVRKGADWYAGNLHAHTFHSDGANSLLALAQKNRAEGFDFLVSTEHNTTRAHWELASVARAVPELLLLPGDEFTSPGGHMNILGSRPEAWFDFRFDPGQGKLPGVIREAHRQGAIVMVNHPTAFCTTCPWQYPANEWREADAIEVWNGEWDITDAAAVKLWDEELRKGRRIHAFGGSDYHRGEGPMVPATLVWAPNLDAKAILGGLRRGNAVIVASPKGPRVTLQVGKSLPGDSVRLKPKAEVQMSLTGAKGLIAILYTDEGRLMATSPLETEDALVTHPLSREAKYVRAELVKPVRQEMVALTNAIFFRR